MYFRQPMYVMARRDLYSIGHKESFLFATNDAKKKKKKKQLQ